MTEPARIPSSGRVREVGVLGWFYCRLAARNQRVRETHVFTTLAVHKRVFWPWLSLAGVLLGFGRLPKRDTELVILRVGHLRRSQYELQHHRRIAKRRGVDAETQAKIFEGPDAEGLTDRQRALLAATDELIDSRTLSPETWHALSRYLDRKQLIEFVMLAGQYDALAATLDALRVPLDSPR